MAVKQFRTAETIYYTTDLNGDFDDRVLATANAVASGGGGAFIVQTLQNELGKNYLNKTWQEIFNAMKSGMPCFAVTLSEGDAPDDNVCYFNPIMYAEGIESNDWEVGVFDGETFNIFAASSNNDYPIIQES